MSLESVATIAQIATFIVIAVTAIAALVQLRHMRSGNQVSALQTFIQMFEGREFGGAFHFVRSELTERLKDPEFRRELRSSDIDRRKHPEIAIANFFEVWGNYYRNGVIDKHAFMQDMAGIVVDFWDRLEPVIAMLSSESGGNPYFENFEFLVIHAREWRSRHPQGTFPAGLRRVPLIDPWKELDAATQQPAPRPPGTTL